MSEGLVQLHGLSVLVVPPDGPQLHSEADALDVVADGMYQGAELVVLPVSRLPAEFFTLSTGLAGAVTQKILNYRMRLAIIGDISAQLAESSALRAYVQESNRGRQLWFLHSMDELDVRLRPAG